MLQMPARCNRPGHWAKDCRPQLPVTSNRSGVYYSSSAPVVRPGAGGLADGAQSDGGDNVLFAQLSEVQEACE